MRTVIEVALAERTYSIHVGSGLMAAAGGLIEPLARGTVPVVTDTEVADRHLERFIASLATAGIAARPIVLPPGEQTKSFAGLEQLCAALLEAGVERGGLVVALGGGVIGDLTGFAAGILKRGVDFVQVPTTLLAQVDSSVGGKTGINTAQGKNLLGLFHQPRLVLADIDVLATLPPRQMRAGYAEIVKYGALGDAAFFAWLEENGAVALSGDAVAMSQAVAHSCRMKAEIISGDEREQGARALLNLGHTFGHALEAATGFSDRLLHGEAVAIGMVLAFQLSAHLGLAPQSDVARLTAHLRQVGLPAAIADLDSPRPSPDHLMALMAHDKKASAGALTFVLARGIGAAFTTRDVPRAALEAVLAA